MITCICEHSVRLDLPTRGYVLDGGCRGFHFSQAMVAQGFRVIALDPGPDIVPPNDPNIIFHREALVAKASGPEAFITDVGDNKYGSHLNRLKGNAGNRVSVNTVDLAQLSARHGVHTWDIIKLDIESAEYEILYGFDRAVATQLTVEFHNWENYDFPKLLKHLNQWYDTVLFGKSSYYGRPGYWDSLFIAKELPGKSV